VPVFVNGSGPFEFLLDTGTTVTVVDPELLQSLRLDVIGDGSITTLAGKAAIPLALAQTVSVGPVTEGKVQLAVRDLAGLRELDAKIHGVLGQNVLKNADYLIDNRKRTIEFDFCGSLSAVLEGERVNTSPIATPESPSYGSTVVPVKLAGPNRRDLNLILDSGSASVVLFSDSLDLTQLVTRSRLPMEDDAGNLKYVPGYLAKLKVGGISLDVEARITATAYKGLAVDGLLPIAGFGSVYISNSGDFVIFQAKRNRRTSGDKSVAAISQNAASNLPCQYDAREVDRN
jgi:predicted aspartyl protease